MERRMTLLPLLPLRADRPMGVEDRRRSNWLPRCIMAGESCGVRVKRLVARAIE